MKTTTPSSRPDKTNSAGIGQKTNLRKKSFGSRSCSLNEHFQPAVAVLILLCVLITRPASAVGIRGGQLFSTGGDVTVEVLPASAGFTSELHLFSPGPDRFIALNSDVGTVVNLGSFPAGAELIFGIFVRNTGNTFLMGPGSRNPDGIPHADVDNQGPGVAVVGFEDLLNGGDFDYDDNVFRFTGGIAPLPCPADIRTGTEPGRCTAVVTYDVTPPSGTTVACVPPSGTTFSVGTTTINCVATYLDGRTATCSFTITVADTEAPKLTCPGNISQCNDPGQCAAVVNYSAMACDNCSGPVVSVYSGHTQTGGGTPYSTLVGSFLASGVSFATDTGFSWHPFGLSDFGADITGCLSVASDGNYTFTLNSDDGSLLLIDGNLVVDDGGAHVPGVASGSASLTAGIHTFEVQFFECCGGPSGVDLGLPAGVSYAGGSVPVTCVPPSGSSFPVGATTVNCSASDAAGNTSTCSFTVTVRDCEAPLIKCPANIVQANDPGQCSAVVSFTASAKDNCSATVTCAPPSGSVFPKGTTTVNCTASDAAGNSASCRFTVAVEDREAPRTACRPGPNPDGNKIPVAGQNPSSGQNPDGFYQLLAKDNCDAAPKIYVQDSASSFVAGPFQNGDTVKITQAPGVTPNQKPMAGVVVAHIQLKGDALLFAVDADGNVSVPASCKVPPPPK